MSIMSGGLVEGWVTNSSMIARRLMFVVLCAACLMVMASPGRSQGSGGGGDRAPILAGEVLPVPAANVLRAILSSAGLTSARVLRTQSTYVQQIDEMIGYFRRNGENMALQTYSGGPGRSAMEFYLKAPERNSKATRDSMVRIIRDGLEKERRSGGQVHLMHTSETHYVFDVQMTSIGDPQRDVDWSARRTAFVGAVEKAVKGGSVSRFLHPGSTPPDNSYHLEIPR